MGDIRVLSQTAGGGTVLVSVDGDEMPVGGFDPELYQPVRLYHADRDELTEPLWLGSALKWSPTSGPTSASTCSPESPTRSPAPVPSS